MQEKNKTEYYKEVLRRLQEYRISWNISKAEMERRLGVDRSLYSRMEKGTRAVTEEILIRMYELGIDIDYLVTGIKSQNTELNTLFEKCKEDRRSDYVNIMVSYMNAMMNNEPEKRLYCRKQMEIMKFNIDKRNGEREDTVWLYIRKNHNLTQEGFNKILDFDIKKYRNLEKGKPAIVTLEVLMNLYLELGYYPSLVQKMDSDYLLMINNAWVELSEDNRATMRTIAARTLKDLNKI